MDAILERAAHALGAAPWLFALFPTLVVIEHVIYLKFTQPPEPKPTALEDETSRSPFGLLATQAVARASRSITDQFGYWALSWRYGAPAAVLAALAFSILRFLFVQSWPAGWSDGVQSAARLGAIGAYLGVVLYFARRVMRHDLTPGGVMSAATTMVLGPVLAGAVGFVLRAKGVPATAESSPWGTLDALFLVLGMAPRRFATAMIEAVKRLWFPDESTAPPPTRIIPLTQIRGITPDIEERLSEEGVYDATTLAMADPITLYRNTSFELRQILCWMDEALLMVFAPEHWQALEKAGMSGAIDLAWYARGKIGAKAEDDPLAPLASAVSLPLPQLRELVRRLAEDAQVVNVWVLYQSGPPATAAA
jgi:hypothetical protein